MSATWLSKSAFKTGSALPRAELAHEAAHRLLMQLRFGRSRCGEQMAALCRDRAREFAAIPVTAAAALVNDSLRTVLHTFPMSVAPVQADALVTLRHLLSNSSLRPLDVTPTFARCVHDGSCTDGA
jgi:hypothetical protein